MSRKRASSAQQLATPEAVQQEIAAMFADVLARKPQTILLIARAGDDLVLRMAGNIGDVVHLYAHGQEEIARILIDSEEIAKGSLNG